jgi:hypothetical protein
MATFAEKFCERHGVPSARYVDVMFWRCLHRRAWPVAPLLRWLAPEFFAPDLELVRGLGRMSSAAALNEEIADFYAHPLNRGFAKRRLRLRLSVRRVKREVYGAFPRQSRSVESPPPAV